jgi:hypothetical protein
MKGIIYLAFLSGIIILGSGCSENNSANPNSEMSINSFDTSFAIGSDTIYMEVNNASIPFTIDTNILVFEIVNNRFNFGATRKEGGLLELTSFPVDSLKVGSFSNHNYELFMISPPTGEINIIEKTKNSDPNLIIAECGTVPGSTLRIYFRGTLLSDSNKIFIKGYLAGIRPVPQWIIPN